MEFDIINSSSVNILGNNVALNSRRNVAGEDSVSIFSHDIKSWLNSVMLVLEFAYQFQVDVWFQLSILWGKLNSNIKVAYWTEQSSVKLWTLGRPF